MKIGLKVRLYLASVAILLIGLGAAISIYFTAEDGAVNVLGYEYENGQAYQIDPETSKRYLHDVELYGGKAAVLAVEFNRWFEGLWHGKTLAISVGTITILVSAILAMVADRLPSDD